MFQEAITQVRKNNQIIIPSEILEKAGIGVGSILKLELKKEGILLKTSKKEIDTTDIDEREWLCAASNNPAFDFLKAPEEDIYTLADGRLFDEEG